eukprot:6331038-Prymnesium_polylepis.1
MRSGKYNGTRGWEKMSHRSMWAQVTRGERYASNERVIQNGVFQHPKERTKARMKKREFVFRRPPTGNRAPQVGGRGCPRE